VNKHTQCNTVQSIVSFKETGFAPFWSLSTLVSQIQGRTNLHIGDDLDNNDDDYFSFCARSARYSK